MWGGIFALVDQPCSPSDRLIRVLLAEVTPVLAAILRSAVGETGIQIVPEVVNDRRKLREVVSREGVDVVILATDKSGFAQEYHHLLEANPEVKVLTITFVDKSAEVYELCLLGKDIGEEGVVEAIRAAVGRKSTVA